MNVFRLAGLALAGLALAACGETSNAPAAAPADIAAEPAPASPPQQADAADAEPPAPEPVIGNGVRILTWEELMPPGEEEALNREIQLYYQNLDNRLMSGGGRQMQLTATQDVAGLGSIDEGSAMDTMPQLGTFNTVDALNAVRIRMPGYVVPLEFASDHRYREFLLVPYFGACLHTPPPPPNQIVYVKTAKPVTIDDIWAPVWAEGEMATTRKDNDLGNAAYTLTLDKLSPYESQ
jgi:hypothetical protein